MDLKLFEIRFKDDNFFLVNKFVKMGLQLRFEATRSDLSLDTKLGIEIAIHDINDNPPRFSRALYEIQVNEVTTQGKKNQQVSYIQRLAESSVLFLRLICFSKRFPSPDCPSF